MYMHSRSDLGNSQGILEGAFLLVENPLAQSI